MFRKMRRSIQQLSDAEVIEILQSGTNGVLALSGDGGYPYAVPLSYVYSDGCIYFHSALSGHKMDAVLRCDKASFCVVAQDEILPEKYTTAFKSVIAFGRIRVMDEGEKLNAVLKLAERYNPGHPAESLAEAEKGLRAMNMLEFKIEHITGKQGKELLKQPDQNN